jgi:hypothetical protein
LDRKDPRDIRRAITAQGILFIVRLENTDAVWGWKSATDISVNSNIIDADSRVQKAKGAKQANECVFQTT